MIRNANKNDLNGIVELWLQMSSLHASHDASFNLKQNAQNLFKDYAKEIIEDNDKLTIVYYDNSVLGYLFAEILNQPPVYLDEQIGLISEVSFHGDARRRGIGKKLLEHAENWLREKSVKRIDCQVATKNPISTNFWNKNGYLAHSKICSKLI